MKCCIFWSWCNLDNVGDLWNFGNVGNLWCCWMSLVLNFWGIEVVKNFGNVGDLWCLLDELWLEFWGASKLWRICCVGWLNKIMMNVEDLLACVIYGKILWIQKFFFMDMVFSQLYMDMVMWEFFIVYGYGKNLVVVYGHVKNFVCGKILVGHWLFVGHWFFLGSMIFGHGKFLDMWFWAGEFLVVILGMRILDMWFWSWEFFGHWFWSCEFFLDMRF